jgi:hypothetical protein
VISIDVNLARTLWFTGGVVLVAFAASVTFNFGGVGYAFVRFIREVNRGNRINAKAERMIRFGAAAVLLVVGTGWISFAVR